MPSGAVLRFLFDWTVVRGGTLIHSSVKRSTTQAMLGRTAPAPKTGVMITQRAKPLNKATKL